MHGRYIDKANFYSGIYTLLILSMYVLLTQKDNDLKMLCVKSALAVACAIVIVFWKSKKVTWFVILLMFSLYAYGTSTDYCIWYGIHKTIEKLYSNR